jgi:aspartyl-tRNA(Asn)/glutamyl-tRNA(Gln) amidotransferase subunit C
VKITRDEVWHVSRLARLDMDESQMDRFAEQIDRILAYVDTLNRVDTSGVAATAHAIDVKNAFRDDEVRPHLERTLALANAPSAEDGCFVVPKVIG